MALEPITRQEKIIAGQDLTPITRMEMFLKNFGGGGGGGGGAFVVTITKDDETGSYLADKTFEEISAEIEAGQNCKFVLIIGTLRGFLTLVTYMPGVMIELHEIGIRPSDLNQPTINDCLAFTSLVCKADNTWQHGYMAYKLTILE